MKLLNIPLVLNYKILLINLCLLRNFINLFISIKFIRNYIIFPKLSLTHFLNYYYVVFFLIRSPLNYPVNDRDAVNINKFLGLGLLAQPIQEKIIFFIPYSKSKFTPNLD